MTQKKKHNNIPVTCAVCSSCFYDLDRDPNKTMCIHGGPYLGYLDLDTDVLLDKDDNILTEKYYGKR